MKYNEIECLLREKGYLESPSLLRRHLSTLKKENQKNLKIEKLENKNISFIERKDITNLLYNPLNSNSNLTETMFNLVCNPNPMVHSIINSVNSFRNILKKKDSNTLGKWMEGTIKLEISELKSFVNGLKKDIDSVKNAIDLEYNNGLAEGTVNKIKVIKRIMYGRCDFNTLRTKVLRSESLKG